MTPATRRAAIWVSALAFGVGAWGLLAPALAAPVTSDSRYHYLMATERFGNNPLQVLPWTIEDIGWRLDAGRITPFGVWYQHILYFLGMKLSLATGTEIHQSEAFIKVALIVAVIATFHWLTGQLRTGAGHAPSPHTRHRAILLFAVLVVSGVTTASPVRNGWTTFVALCIGGCALMFAVAAATTQVSNGWQAWGRVRRVLGVVALVVIGALLVLSYELHWAAFPMTIVLVVLNGRASWRPRSLVARDPGRWWSLAALSAGFLPTLALTRWLIRTHSDGSYAGLTVDLSGPVLRTIGLQFINSIPGTGNSTTLQAVPPGAAAVTPLGGGGWLWGLLFALGAAGLVALLWSAAPTQDVTPAPARRPWAGLGLALATGALAGSAILSISPQAQQIVATLGATYRGTPWLWVCMAGIVTCAVCLLPTERAQWRTALVVLISVPLVVGTFVWPYSAAATLTLRNNDSVARIEALERHAVLGSTTPWAEADRCRLDERITQGARSTYGRAFNANLRSAYQAQWGRPLCAARAQEDAVLDAAIHEELGR